MQQQENRIQYLEKRIAKIPDPFSISYRPPGENYKSLPDALDAVCNRLNNLEEKTRDTKVCHQRLECKTK